MAKGNILNKLLYFGNTLNVSAIKDVDGNTLKAAQNYTIVNIQSDRTGFSALMLEEI